MDDERAGRDALSHLDRALAAKPRRDGEELAAAMGNLAAFRDAYIARHRQQGGRRYRATLDRINAIISLVMAADYPLGEIPWSELDQGRGWLAEILKDEEPR